MFSKYYNGILGLTWHYCMSPNTQKTSVLHIHILKIKYFLWLVWSTFCNTRVTEVGNISMGIKHARQYTQTFSGIFALSYQIYCNISACASRGIQKWDESGLSTPTMGFQWVWRQIFCCVSQPTDRRSFEAVASALSATARPQNLSGKRFGKTCLEFYLNKRVFFSKQMSWNTGTVKTPLISSHVKLILLSCFIGIRIYMWVSD